jgi:hypothetical protein
MNIRAPSACRAAHHNLRSELPYPAARQLSPRMTRRQLVRTAAGSAVLGGMLGSGLFKPGLAAPKASFTPVPVPNTPFHVFAPMFGTNPIDAEPSTITNLNGFVGLAYVTGMVTRTDTTTGKSMRFPFVNSDMRFMQGAFEGADGRIHQGTFAFV